VSTFPQLGAAAAPILRKPPPLFKLCHFTPLTRPAGFLPLFIWRTTPFFRSLFFFPLLHRVGPFAPLPRTFFSPQTLDCIWHPPKGPNNQNTQVQLLKPKWGPPRLVFFFFPLVGIFPIPVLLTRVPQSFLFFCSFFHRVGKKPFFVGVGGACLSRSIRGSPKPQSFFPSLTGFWRFLVKFGPPQLWWGFVNPFFSKTGWGPGFFGNVHPTHTPPKTKLQTPNPNRLS